MSCIDTVHTVHPCATTQEIAPEMAVFKLHQIAIQIRPGRTWKVRRRWQGACRRSLKKTSSNQKNFGPNIYVMSIYLYTNSIRHYQMHINVITGAGLLASRHQPVAKQYSIISRNAQLQKMSVKLHAVHPSLESYRQTSAELSSHLGCQGAASSSPKILITYLSESWFIASKSLMENIWKMKNETANGNKTPTLQHFWGPVCTLCRARHKTGRGWSTHKDHKISVTFFSDRQKLTQNEQNDCSALQQSYERVLAFWSPTSNPGRLCGVEPNFAPFEAWSNSWNSVRSTAVHNQESWTGVVTLVSL